jgi:hypothetical protein
LLKYIEAAVGIEVIVSNNDLGSHRDSDLDTIAAFDISFDEK